MRVPAIEGAYARLPVWRSRSWYLQVVAPAALAARPDALRIEDGGRTRRINPATWLRWLQTEADAADSATGRGIRLTPRQVAERAGMSTRYVQHCRAVARTLGLLVDVVHGRHLTRNERLEAYEQGSRQRGLANESCLTVPTWLRGHLGEYEQQHMKDRPRRRGTRPKKPRRTVRPSNTAPVDSHTHRHQENPDSGECCTPPCRDPGPTETFSESLTTAFTLQAAMAASPARTTRGHQHRHDRRTRRPHHDLSAGYQLAQTVTAAIPWLRNARTHPQRIAPMLTRFATAHLPWTADDIINALDQINTRMGWTALTSTHIKTNPWAVLASYLRHLDPDADHPRLPHLLAADHARSAAAQARIDHATAIANRSPNPEHHATRIRHMLARFSRRPGDS